MEEGKWYYHADIWHATIGDVHVAMCQDRDGSWFVASHRIRGGSLRLPPSSLDVAKRSVELYVRTGGVDE